MRYANTLRPLPIPFHLPFKKTFGQRFGFSCARTSKEYDGRAVSLRQLRFDASWLVLVELLCVVRLAMKNLRKLNLNSTRLSALTFEGLKVGNNISVIYLSLFIKK